MSKPTQAIGQQRLGNLLGNPRAEADSRMLDQAFVETADFRALANTNDFHTVVGRRGTGKSALFRQLQVFFGQVEHTLVHAEVPQEHHALATQAQLSNICQEYNAARAIARLLWRAYVLRVVGEQLRSHYRVKSSRDLSEVEKFMPGVRPEGGVYAYFSEALRGCQSVEAADVPKHLAISLGIESLQKAVATALRDVNSRAVVLFDDLDEGWMPEVIPTALLGALALAAADLSDAETSIHVIAFVRDNMFRALAKLDPDFSSHVEGSDLRLHWDKNALFHLVTKRIRVALDLKIESDTKVWDRIAQRELQGRDGFERCLQHTLYRPRDALVLLNRATRRNLKIGC